MEIAFLRRVGHGRLAYHRGILRLAGAVLAVMANSSTWAASTSVSLDDAMLLAEQRSPSVRSLQAARGAAEAELAETRALLWNNPQFNLERRRRQLAQPSGGYDARQDSAVGINQTFETGGQPRARRIAAEAALEASRQAVEQAKHEVRLEAARQFISVLQLQFRVDIERAGADLLNQAAQNMAKRVRAGEDTRLDGNLAQVEAERAQGQLSLTRDELNQARATLGTSLQLAPGELPEAVGVLRIQEIPPYLLEDLLAAAQRHPRLLVSAARARTAEGKLGLERANRYPDLTFGISSSQEKNVDGADRVTTFALSLPLPLFRNNGAAIARAGTELAQLQIELQAAQRDSESKVRLLWQRADLLRHRAQRLEEATLPPLMENQRLSLAALRAGEIGITQFLLARRQTLEAQRELTEAQAQAVLARFELESAAGWVAPVTAAGAARPADPHEKEVR